MIRFFSSASRLLAAPSIDRAASVVSVPLPGGGTARFHGIWLRDHCLSSRHPLSSQRLLETHSLPLNLCPVSAAWEEAAGGGAPALALTWPGGHVSRFPAPWLQRHAYWVDGPPPPSLPPPPLGDPLSLWDADPLRDTRARVVWDGARFGPPSAPHGERPFPRVTHAEVASERGLLRALRALRDFGFVLVEGVAPTEAATRAVCARFGYLRPTLYGRGMWRTEVRVPSSGAVTDTAFESIPLPLHTDGNYLVDLLGLQAFHCVVRDEGGGGESLLMDGLAVAERLQARAPDAFTLLCAWPLRYHHTGGDGVMGAARPVFSLHEDGSVAGVHFNNDDRGPVLRVPDWAGAVARSEALLGRGMTVAGALAHPATAVPALYAALKELGALLRDPSLTLRLPLHPGTVLVFDNTRTLHGREGFDATSGRTLLGAYVGADDWHSKLRLLTRKLGADKIDK
jgi:alpha-ketoglutarate-dependent taurine dioxygenase